VNDSLAWKIHCHTTQFRLALTVVANSLALRRESFFGRPFSDCFFTVYADTIDLCSSRSWFYWLNKFLLLNHLLNCSKLCSTAGLLSLLKC
jgi:hypothetical protein